MKHFIPNTTKNLAQKKVKLDVFKSGLKLRKRSLRETFNMDFFKLWKWLRGMLKIVKFCFYAPTPPLSIVLWPTLEGAPQGNLSSRRSPRVSQAGAPSSVSAAPRCRQTGEKQPTFMSSRPGASPPASPTTPPLSPGRVRVSRKCSEAEARFFLSLSALPSPAIIFSFDLRGESYLPHLASGSSTSRAGREGRPPWAAPPSRPWPRPPRSPATATNSSLLPLLCSHKQTISSPSKGCLPPSGRKVHNIIIFNILVRSDLISMSVSQISSYLCTQNDDWPFWTLNENVK